MQQRTEQIQIDVAATDHHADALALQLACHGASRSNAKATRRLDHQLHPFGKEAHALDELRIGGRQDVVDVATDNLERKGAEMLGLRAVGNRFWRVDMHDGARAERLLSIITGFRFDAVEGAIGRKRPCR